MRKYNRIPAQGSYAADQTAEIVAKRNAKLAAKRTVQPTRVSTVRETVTLESPKAKVIGNIGPKGRDLSWLMADCLSTPSGYRA